MTSTSSERRRSISSNRKETFKFPDFEQPLPLRENLLLSHQEEVSAFKASARTTSPNAYPKTNGKSYNSESQQHRRGSHVAWANVNGHAIGSGPSHNRQKSLSDAIRTIRTRKGSVSANAQEIAEALKAPVSIKLIVWGLPCPDFASTC